MKSFVFLRRISRCRQKIYRNLCTNSSQQEEKNRKWPRVIFSGVQPTGSMHIGNYFGAIQNWVHLQKEECPTIFSIVDLHSITIPQNPLGLSNNIIELTATLLACGIDPDRSTLFLQSAVPQHTQLCWHLACITTMARLSHLPQYKEKSHLMKDVPLGLFIYPVLQAADILVHKATEVPVGEDQLQHLQLAQHLAKIFNHHYGDTFPYPHAIVPSGSSCRIKSLREPMKKMSKSEIDPKSRILLIDTPETIREKVKKAVTDFTSEVTYEPDKRPGVSNLIGIHSLLTGKTTDSICDEMQNRGLDTGKYKFVVADVISEYLTPIREKALDLLSKPSYLQDVLEHGSKAAMQRAEITLEEVNEKVGTTSNKSPQNNFVAAKL